MPLDNDIIDESLLDDKDIFDNVDNGTTEKKNQQSGEKSLLKTNLLKIKKSGGFLENLKNKISKAKSNEKKDTNNSEDSKDKDLDNISNDKNEDDTKENNAIVNEEDIIILDEDSLDKDTSSQETVNNNSNIINILLEKNIISKSQMSTAKIQANKTGKSLLQCLIDMSFVSEEFLQKQFNHSSDENEGSDDSFINFQPVYELVQKIPNSFATEQKVIPIKKNSNGEIVVATINPYDIVLMDQLSNFFGGAKIKLEKYSESLLMQQIDKLYRGKTIELSEIIGSKMKNLDIDGDQDVGDNDIIRYVNALIENAIKKHASDIHIEPEELFIRVRFRIDGILQQETIIHKNYWSAICVRIKVLAGMNIAESRRPQDAAITMNICGRDIDFRVSTIPTIYGENFVLRVLDKATSLTTLENLGFSDHSMRLIDLALNKPEGIIVVTGPTGSGKTTTLYSILNKINDVEDNIMTLEDPVEYRLPMIRQSEMNHRAGFDFAAGLRSLLRQDPDIIFLGEIRDQETATNAVRASITGHQVFSTLHTNCAVATINRLIDMGIPPYLLSGSLTASISQRLVRKLCPHCKKRIKMDDKRKRAFELNMDEEYYLYEPVGCDKCSNGFVGRVCASEVLFVDDVMNMTIAENPTLKQATDVAEKQGFISIQKDCIDKIITGVSCWNEVIRVVDMTKYINRLNSMD